MGVVLDTSVPIKAQRQRMTDLEMLRSVRAIVGDVELATSTIVLTELLQGVLPASNPEIRRRRQAFFDEFVRDIPALPYVVKTAYLAGELGGQQRAKGSTIPTIDLMIGATALLAGFAILTANVRHFTEIPDLKVVPF